MLSIHYPSIDQSEGSVERATRHFIESYNGLCSATLEPVRVEGPIRISRDTKGVIISAVVEQGHLQDDGGVEYNPVNLTIVV